MARLMGIDLGTSQVKAVIADERGHIQGVGTCEIATDKPRPDWAEQDPSAWWQATIYAVRQALEASGEGLISAIGLSGQMHGTVLVNSQKAAIGPAIIWADQRSVHEVGEIYTLVGKESLARITGTAPATGFMAATLLWLQRHEPARLDQATYCMLPKDYLRLCLTGNVATDASDASGTALFDIAARRWSSAIIELLSLPAHIWPPVLDSAAIGGHLTSYAAEALGLVPGMPVVVGCADQPAQALGNGLIDPGAGSITIGTGGQLFAPLAAPLVDEQLRLHVFCHAPADRWYLLGATLAAGRSLRWFRDLLGLTGMPTAYAQLSALAAGVEPRAGGLLFLPYLQGERAPIMDPHARGAFVGLTMAHGRGHMARAIMEGVAFSLRQVLEVMVELGAPLGPLLASGNGLSSPVWRQIVADALDRPLRLSIGQERAGLGAALLAGLGVGIYSSYAEARAATIEPFEITEPDPRHVEQYTEQYHRFLQLYPLLKPMLHDLSGAGREHLL